MTTLAYAVRDSATMFRRDLRHFSLKLGDFQFQRYVDQFRRLRMVQRRALADGDGPLVVDHVHRFLYQSTDSDHTDERAGNNVDAAERCGNLQSDCVFCDHSVYRRGMGHHGSLELSGHRQPVPLRIGLPGPG